MIKTGPGILDIARVCHEANRAYCAALGDDSQLPWDEAPQWQRDSALAGVEGIATGAILTHVDSHVSWRLQKEQEGWRYGPVKDPEKKEHPCMVPFDMLPPEQQMKDRLFFAVATALLG